jgi:hypothetical protein
MKTLFALVAILVLALVAVPAFATQPVPDGSADATSQVGGSVLSSNYTVSGIGGSLAIEKAYNASYAGFTIDKCGNTVSTSAFGSSAGYTIGLVIGTGVAQGAQTGAFNAFATGAIPAHGSSH